MKKILLMLTVMIMTSFAVSAQSRKFVGTVYNPTNSVSSISVDTMYIATPTRYSAHGIQLTKTQGNTLTATAVLYGSHDGGNYYFPLDTVTVATGAVKTYNLSKTNPTYTNYRWIITGGGSGNGLFRSDLTELRNY